MLMKEMLDNRLIKIVQGLASNDKPFVPSVARKNFQRLSSVASDAARLMFRWRFVRSGLVPGVWMLLLAFVAATQAGETDIGRLDGIPMGSVALQLFYSGQRGGALESCGCSSSQDGGLQYEATLLRRLAGDAPGVRVDAGAWTLLRQELYPLDALKAHTLLRGLHLLGYDAVNVGRPDLAWGIAFFQNFKGRYPQEQPPFVSANIFLKSDPARPAFSKWVGIKRTLAGGRQVSIGVTGVTDRANASPKGTPAESEGFLVGDPIRSLAPVVAELRPKVDLLIVLCSCSEVFTGDLAKAFPQVDLFVTTAQPHPTRDAATAPAQPRILVVRGAGGQRIGVASLRADELGRWTLSGAPSSSLVSNALPADQAMQQLIDTFKTETRDLDTPRPGPQAREVYAGSSRCALCHQKISGQWAATPHARAMRTLADRNQLYNPECVRCHTTGYRQDNGFYSVKQEASQAMLNVQCEACHGPARQHANEQMQIVAGAALQMPPDEYRRFLAQAKKDLPRRVVPQTICRKCHDPAHDAHFSYQTKIHKVRHTQPKPDERQAETRP